MSKISLSNSGLKPELGRNSLNISASGSATGNPRNKVALQPGHSLMDWIRLTHSGVDLTGMNGVVHDVTLEELRSHNRESDCWLAIRGTVFNVTRYLRFHPGGVEQLMLGAGKDATEMFDKVHAYVNYTSILQKCVVGRLVQESPGTSEQPTSFRLPKLPSKSSDKIAIPLDWYQSDATISIVFYTKIPNPQVVVHLVQNELTTHIKFSDRVITATLSLSGKVKWPCRLTVSSIGKVDIEWEKLVPGKWEKYGTPCQCTRVWLVEFEEDEPKKTLTVVDTVPVNHNTKLIILRYEEQIYNYIPIGHHMLIHHKVEENELIRMYTPVPPMIHGDFLPATWSVECICLMVKMYPTGVVSPWLCDLKKGDTVQATGPQGQFNIHRLRDNTHLYLIAAGTGITPMLALITWSLQTNKKCKHVSLMFFNRTQADILWFEQFERLSATDDRFTVQHVLSAPDSKWKGSQGHINELLLKAFIPNAKVDVQQFVCVCGTTGFTQLARSLLETRLLESQYHCFVG